MSEQNLIRIDALEQRIEELEAINGTLGKRLHEWQDRYNEDTDRLLAINADLLRNLKDAHWYVREYRSRLTDIVQIRETDTDLERIKATIKKAKP